MPHLTTFGGAQKALRAATELLAERGHEVCVVCVEPRTQSGAPVAATALRPRALGVACSGVDVVVARGIAEMLSRGRSLRREWGPDVVLVPSEDPAQRPLREALRWHVPVVVVAQTPATLPFGEGAAVPGRVDPGLFFRANAILATSRFLADYIQRAGFPARRVRLPPIPQRAPGANPQFDERPYALLINPAVVKGVSIFLQVAAALPHHAFAAVPTWATGTADRRKLSHCSNVSILEPRSNVYELLRQARVLLVPSLWLENAPLVITEAMLARVPVIASNVGGIPEVMLGTGASLPVSLVEWQNTRTGGVRALAPPQPAAAWISATARLMDNEKEWALARDSAHRAVVAWLRGFDIAELESHLLSVVG